MQLFERVIRRTELWLELVDRERDAAMRAKPERSHESWRTWVDRLEAERGDLVALLEELRRLQHRRPLLFARRPCMVRVTPAHTRRRRVAKGA